MEKETFITSVNQYFNSQGDKNFFSEIQLQFIDALAAMIAQKTQLIYISESKEGNLCFANNNEELQDAFKQSFTFADILKYMVAIFKAAQYQSKSKAALNGEKPEDFPLPNDNLDFWNRIKS